MSTFFARDLLALSAAGIDVDVFVLHPEDPSLWSFVPQTLNDRVLPRDRVHHSRLTEPKVWTGSLGVLASRRSRAALGAAAKALTTEARGGPRTFAATAYLIPKTWAWAHRVKGAYDHVVAYWGNYSATAAWIFQQITRTPYFTTFLHAGVDLYRPTPMLSRKLVSADNIVVVCEFNREFLRTHFGPIFPDIEHKITLHHLGLDLDELRYVRDGRSDNEVLAVGRLDHRKGFEHLISAFARLHPADRDLLLTIVGDGPEEVRLRERAASLGIGERVTFTGSLPFPAVRAKMEKATVLVHPSPDLGDAVPTVIKEAMALGLPVIGSRVAGIPELLDNGEAGILVEPKDVGSLAAAIDALLDDPEKRDRFALNARRFAEMKFDTWRNGRQLARVLTGGGDDA